jgi:hypothetical protein
MLLVTLLITSPLVMAAGKIRFYQQLIRKQQGSKLKPG